MTNVERKRERSKHQPTGQWIRTDKRLAIYLRDSFRCAYCGSDLHGAAAAAMTLDHLISQAQGGHNGETNLVTACRTCNCSRQENDWRAFASLDAARRIETKTQKNLRRYLTQARGLIARQRVN